ncbi:hypothetical protein [Maribellus maritimus]|uniref:hypothetical protein n=1 Tax=Maribellus maritimus TaxID=2870838 RepID=UPI001EEB813C|nr:hypothetical protein [Maribellus maritimus]MCG6187505.1 hypothetical protein [Maribellus maritimus]
MKILLLVNLLFLTTLSKPVFSSENDSIVTNVFSHIYNEQYAEAHATISANRANLESFYTDVLTIDLFWWEFVQAKQNNEKQKVFLSFLEKFDSTYVNDAELKQRQLIKNSYQIRYEFKRFNIIGAINTRATIKKLLDEITSENLDYPENRMKLLSLYSSLFQYFDNLINPLFSKNRREIRAKALVEVEGFTGENDIIVKTLSLYFLGRIYLNIEKDDKKGIRYFTELSEYYPKNKLFKEVLEKHK